MRSRHAAGIFAVLLFTVSAIRADDFWIKKEWKQWTAAECTRLLEDSPWAKKILVDNEVVKSRLPDAPNITDGLNPGQAKYAADDDAGEIRYVVQIISSSPIRRALMRQEQINRQYDKMKDAEKIAFDARMETQFPANAGFVVVHVKYHADREPLGADLEKWWKSLPTKTVPANLLLIMPSGAKVAPLSYAPDSMGGDEFDLTFPRSAFEQGVKYFRLQIPSPALGDYAARKAIAEFKLDKMTFEGNATF
jgi:hypothetical protein